MRQKSDAFLTFEVWHYFWEVLILYLYWNLLNKHPHTLVQWSKSSLITKTSFTIQLMILSTSLTVGNGPFTWRRSPSFKLASRTRWTSTHFPRMTLICSKISVGSFLYIIRRQDSFLTLSLPDFSVVGIHTDGIKKLNKIYLNVFRQL